MSLAQIARFRPAGPWRLGPDSGASDRVDRLLHSDTLYSALTLAMRELGRMEEWLDATARPADPAVRLTSAFPFHGDTLFAPPPMNHWPPAPTPRVRWKGARFVPLQAIARLLREGGLNENDWIVDAESECLIPVGKGRSGAPFRIGVRSGAAVDRLSGAVAGHSVACLEFAPGAGFWMAVSYANEQARAAWWQDVAAALRLLGDTGIGGERSRGWGRSETVEVRDAGGLFAPFVVPAGGQVRQPCWWLLSLFSPADDEQVDWTHGAFATITRSGRAPSGELKRSSRMVAEGSVLMSGAPLRGIARDVAPGASEHPVYRWGAAFAIPAYARAIEPRAAEPKSEGKEAALEPAQTAPAVTEAPAEGTGTTTPLEPMPVGAESTSEPAEPTPGGAETTSLSSEPTPGGVEATAEPLGSSPVGTESTSEPAEATPSGTESTPEPSGSAPVGAETTTEPSESTPVGAESTTEPSGPAPIGMEPTTEPSGSAPVGTESTTEPSGSTPVGADEPAEGGDDAEERPE